MKKLAILCEDPKLPCGILQENTSPEVSISSSNKLNTNGLKFSTVCSKNIVKMSKLPSHNAQFQQNTMMSKATAIPTSRIPSVQRGHSLTNEIPVLSPKTPNLAGIDFPNFCHVSEENTESALKAIDLYANTIMSKKIESPPDYFDAFASQPYPSSYDPSNIQSIDSKIRYTDYNGMQPVDTESSLDVFPYSSSNGSTFIAHNESKINQLPPYQKVMKIPSRKSHHPMKTLRPHHISLDPNEREDLEKLIEEVIYDGVGDGVIDSDYNDTSDDNIENDTPIEEMPLEQDMFSQVILDAEGRQIFPQSQLKVAAKHMKNLPPRFQRRLKVGEAGGDSPEAKVIDASMGISPLCEKQPQRKEEKKMRFLLQGMFMSSIFKLLLLLFLFSLKKL